VVPLPLYLRERNKKAGGWGGGGGSEKITHVKTMLMKYFTSS